MWWMIVFETTALERAFAEEVEERLRVTEVTANAVRTDRPQRCSRQPA